MAGETPERCVAREVQEELGATVEVGPILAAWVYEVLPGRNIFVVAHAVRRMEIGPLSVSAEHRQMRWWDVDGLPATGLPAGNPARPGMRLRIRGGIDDQRIG